ncbi:MAG TPA: hypothetical protein VNY29_01255 [Terriglobales bacterium]|jgi:hypothetical protein|nr:hypothetical protein [Terriglobales bacterium]
MNLARVLAVAAILVGVFAVPGCSEGQKLVGITVLPQNESITGSGGIVNYQAIGNYTHPPESKDLTHSVVWTSSSPQVISIDPATGEAISGGGCGTNILITAALYSKPANPASGTVAIGTSTVNVTQANGVVCQ